MTGPADGRKLNVVAELILCPALKMARSTMTQAARLERLEQKVHRLERRMARAKPDREDERVRARLLVLRHLRKHKEIDGVKLAAKHGLIFNDVEEALRELEEMGSIETMRD